VVNQSFGEIIGSHDGLSPYDQFINDMATAKPGRALVYAAGNFGNRRVHAQYTFTEDTQVALATDVSGSIIDIWRTETDGQKHLSVKLYMITDDGIKECPTDGYLSHEVCDYNHKEHIYYEGDDDDDEDGRPLIVISGKKGDHINAWTDQNSDFSSIKIDELGLTTIGGDSEMSLGDSGHCAANAFSVANYTTRGTIIDGTGSQYVPNDTEVGQLAKASSKGPTTNSAIRKPDVAAPGTLIYSASDLMSYDGPYEGEKVTINGVEYFYQFMNGTSQAAPMLTGSIALWLQANPNLTCEQLHEIVNNTSRHDQFTGDEEWSPLWGYGKLDTYAGLKMALQMAGQTGIPSVYGTEQPVSLKKQSDAWQLLFNNDEPHADITVYDNQGRICQSLHLTQLHRAQEVTVPLRSLLPGVYVIKITTAKSKIVRKFSK